jgi:hypothetical protein
VPASGAQYRGILYKAKTSQNGRITCVQFIHLILTAPGARVPGSRRRRERPAAGSEPLKTACFAFPRADGAHEEE